MKILIVTGMTLPEVTDEELEAIYVASGEGDIVVAHSADDAREHWPDTEVAMGIIDRETFPTARNLRWLHSTAAGADMLMYPEMVDSDVVLTGEKGLVGEHLADHAFGLLLTLTRQLKRATLEAPNSWPSRPSMRKVMFELSGHTMGIVGLGGTGRSVARRARAFGMDCIAVDSEPVPPSPDVSELWGMDRFHDLLAASDVVTVCCPLTPETRGLFNDAAFAAMKPGLTWSTSPAAPSSMLTPSSGRSRAARSRRRPRRHPDRASARGPRALDLPQRHDHAAHGRRLAVPRPPQRPPLHQEPAPLPQQHAPRRGHRQDKGLLARRRFVLGSHPLRSFSGGMGAIAAARRSNLVAPPSNHEATCPQRLGAPPATRRSRDGQLSSKHELSDESQPGATFLPPAQLVPTRFSRNQTIKQSDNQN